MLHYPDSLFAIFDYNIRSHTLALYIRHDK